MNRTVLTSNFGSHTLRHIVRIESDPCEEGDFRTLATLLHNIFGNHPDLVRHIAPCPCSGRFYYENRRWIFESESLSPRLDIE